MTSLHSVAHGCADNTQVSTCGERKLEHYPFDNQLEPHKAKQREEARQAIVARIEAERKRQADECVKRWAERTQNVLDK